MQLMAKADGDPSASAHFLEKRAKPSLIDIGAMQPHREAFVRRADPFSAVGRSRRGEAKW
jgi:hypothetical protein